MNSKPTAALADFLDERARAVKAIEAQAEEIIHVHKDQPGYQAKMREKAELLAALARDAAGLAAALPSPLAGAAGERLARFSESAGNALGIGSAFYMSALLYPDEHKPGEPNDLERYAAEVRSWG